MFLEKHTLILASKWLIKILAIFLIVLSFSLLSYWFYFENRYQGKILPGIVLGKYDLSGMPPEVARTFLNGKIDNINKYGITFSFQNKEAVITTVSNSDNSDLAIPLISFDAEETIKRAYDSGRQKNFWQNMLDRLKNFTRTKKIDTSVTINQAEILKILKSDFGKFEVMPQDAKIYVKDDGSFAIKAEKLGNTINYDNGLQELESNLKNLSVASITLKSELSNPLVTSAQIKNIPDNASLIVKQAPIKITYTPLDGSASTTWKISAEALANLIDVKSDSQPDNQISLALNQEKITDYLNRNIASAVNRLPQKSRFQFKDGKVSEFKQGLDGLELDIPKTIDRLNTEIFVNHASSVEISVNSVKGDTNNENDDQFIDIKELIGTGHSRFTGSPKNRRSNIRTGANAVNGVLVMPNEEFSLIKTLGKIDESSGYKPELVIKGNKTVPEFGGGLCQIGTTVFRAAVESGLPITMRQNHSYRVSYYEPAGTDATIYDPLPDLRFKNDTGNYILIQSRIEGDNLFFDFWGTKDGRIATHTYPTIYNIVKPPATKIIETLSLKPGEKKCTEKAHNGADAFFDYKITYPNDTVKQKRFSSHYVPWREVCLLGVEKLSASAVASSTAQVAAPITP